MSDLHLLLESSGRAAMVGLARGEAVVQQVTLDEARRHVRDLAETVRRLCTVEAIEPRELASVVVGIGPGSYTGLRVGLASAKTFAYATGCKLVAVPTFHAIVEAVPPAEEIDIVADALRGQVYVQRFRHASGNWEPMHELKIVAEASYTFAAAISRDLPTLQGLWSASRRLQPLTRDALFAVEPLYLRGSSAEEKRKAQSAASASSAS